MWHFFKIDLFVLLILANQNVRLASASRNRDGHNFLFEPASLNNWLSIVACNRRSYCTSVAFAARLYEAIACASCSLRPILYFNAVSSAQLP